MTAPELVDHVVVTATDLRDGRSYDSITYFRYVSHPRFLPDAARTEETVGQWKAWHRAHNTKYWREYQKGAE